MATTREQFIALRKSGMTPVQAREEVMKTVTPTTPGLSVKDAQGFVAGTPTYNQGQNNGWGIEDSMNPRYANRASTNVNQQQLINNQNKVQAEIQAGTRPAVGTSATPQAGQTQATTPTTPTTLPPAPINSSTTPSGATLNSDGSVTPAPAAAPVQTPAPTTPVETTAPIDKNAEIKAKNEAQMALNKQKSELAIQERKQQEADAKLASTPTDQKGVLNALVSGVTVPTQNTAAYRNAQAQYKNYQKFSTMTPSQLVSNMKMGEIDTATSQLLANNPSYIQAKQEFEKFQKNQSINKMVQSVANGATGKVKEVDHGQEASDALAKKLGIDETNADAYARIVSKNPEVVQLTQTVSSITKQLNTLNTERNAVYADLKKQYPDMSPSGIMTLMSSRTKQATDEIDALNSSLSLTTADLKTAMEMARGEYEATSADITLQSDIAKEQRQMDNTLALNQAEYDQKIAQQAQAMGTPELAIPEVINQYAELGVMAQKSAQQHIADAKALIAKGGTLGEYISQMQKDFQAKDAYKAKFAPKATENYELKEVGGKTYKFNQATGQYEIINGGTTSSVTPTGTLTPVKLGDKTVTLDSVASQAMTSAFDEIKTTGQNLIVGEGHRDQVATIKSMAERYGIPFNASNPSETAKKLTAAGHTVAAPGLSKHETGMAIDIYSDGMKAPTPEQVKILNAKGWFQTAGANDMGHFEYLGVQGTGTQASSDAQNWFNLIQKGTTSYEDVMKKLGGTKVGQAVLQEINGLISSQGGAIPALPDSPQVKQMDTLLDTVKGLVEDPDAIENLSGFFQTSPWDAMTGKNDDTRSAIEFLVKGQTLQQLIDAKAQGATFGALSNEELRMLQNSASRLTAMIEFDENDKVKNFKGKEETVKAELKKLLNLFKEKREKMVNPGMNQSTQQNMTPEVEEEINAFDAWQANQ